MNKLSIERRTQILAMLIEGHSISSICRVTNAAKNTVLKLLAEVGEACALYQDRVMRNLKCQRIQCNEIWSFIGMKEKNVPEEVKGTLGYGDVYTWTAIDADTKLMPCWHVGSRNSASAYCFIQDLASRLSNRIQLTTDGLQLYIDPIDESFGGDIDYAMLVKTYGSAGRKENTMRYSPAEYTETMKRHIADDLDVKHVSTSYVERANLTMRMGMRRFTRLTNAFSKKLENHMHAISLHFMHYNFCRIHKTLRIAPAMEAEISDYIWDLKDIVMMADTNM
jgi:hypothetical protein